MISTANTSGTPAGRRQAVPEAPSNRVVSKPVSDAQARDPRKYQLEQIKRRFSLRQTNLQNGTTLLAFNLKPSDPDFPFDLDLLDCELLVPAAYPDAAAAPVLKVKNKDIPRGFAINIEQGWDKLVEERREATLLALTNALDRSLETYLSEKKQDTVTLMSFKDTRHLESETTTLGKQQPPVKNVQEPSGPVSLPSRSYLPEPSYTKDEINAAKARRAQETRQLEARMSRLSMYQRSSDGVVYTLPLEPRRRTELPTGLQAVQSVQLIVPLLYPLQPLRVLLNDVESKDAEAVEELFAKRAAQQTQMSLMSHINFLSQNMHLMVKQAQQQEAKQRQEAAAAAKAAADLGTSTAQSEKMPVTSSSHGKTHIQVIPRPPEWIWIDKADDTESSDDSWDELDSDEGGVAVNPQEPSTAPLHQPERGTAISFPSIELHGIELFQVALLSLSVKCERCRTINDLTGLRPGLEKSSSCKKCATPFATTFRPEMVHQGSTRAGFIDVSGCTVADMLPSTFIPTCSTCSTASPGLVSVRGDVTNNVCRECHNKFSFKIPDVKFLAITRGATLPPSAGPRRKLEKLGLHVGEQLPDRGSCPHYKRSYRWFRFSCCSKVHPCDKCHDEAEDHINEWANRMICGWCSREQNYAVEACGFCGRSVIGKKGRGFWEGGKGTRDKTKMSRKDPRKYKRVGGGETKKKD
ncbi:CHY zinc finger domain protein [Microdochium trichocladiopsis]|uniref:CHY zinc finger domain protein n=1 Tax=Microdochium trichocladiopsis TaxID=1682393 RepID=A0A9P9BNN3_9PEZI|nr:CHY zinc finger domain protein [Microdochium trichocladiopsis]KAH7027923.1 CHY zinc finger domain protein [Microdochium trichocladiopsis]